MLGAVVAAVLIAFAGRYGYHRDELYFLEAGDNLAWGYPDQGPVTPLLAAAADAAAPGSLTALRVIPALMTGTAVFLTGRIARELGGSRRAEAIAAACLAVASVFLTTGHLLSTTTSDLLAWTAITYLVVRAVRRGDDRLWPVAGVVLGLALLNKSLPAFLAMALLAGVAIAGPRRLLKEPRVWAAVAIAIVIWLPWLVWQSDRGWPQLDVSGNIAEGGSASSEPRWAFLPFQLLLVSPLLAPVWIAGLVRLLRDPRLRDVRFLGWAWVVLAVVFLATAGKPYYLSGLFPVLLAAGAGSVEGWLERGRRRARRIALGAALGASAVICATIALPILPTDALDPVVAANEDVAETVGWPRFADQVAAVPGSRSAVILATNYGEAGAIDRYGPARGLPQPYSGHNGYGYWRIPPASRGPVLLIGGQGREHFEECRLAGRIATDPAVDNEEDGAPLWMCDRPLRPWRELWPRLRRLG